MKELKKIWLWSDLHLGHEKIYKQPFPSAYDSTKPMRPFASSDEADNQMVVNYNKLIGQDDIIYFLGDIAFNKKALSLVGNMKKGNKYLVMGNHDKFTVSEYLKYFKKIYGVAYINKIGAILTHTPVHSCLLDNTTRFNLNFFGHMHDRNLYDHRYINVSVEQTNYSPKNLWDYKDRFSEELKKYGGTF